MIRHLFTILAALSLLLFMTTGVLWLKGNLPSHFEIIPDNRLLICWTNFRVPVSEEAAKGGGLYHIEEMIAKDQGPNWNLLGFAYDTDATEPRYHLLWIPYPYLLLLTGILPCIWILRHRHVVQRGRLNSCVKCGYDLRATPDRCPECGTTPTRPSK
jgi:hypothetical protein